MLSRVPSESVDAFETTLLPDNVVSNGERMLLNNQNNCSLSH